MTSFLEGFQLFHLDRADSTNNYAARLIKLHGVSGPAVILAEEQFAGRGQRGARWEVEPGKNLTLSLIASTRIPVEELFSINLNAALAVRQTLDLLIPHQPVQIKWPNDIYVDQGKISGILVENMIRGTQVEHSIVGIGLNVNQMEFEQPNATSLGKTTGKTFELMDVLRLLLKQWNHWNNQPERALPEFLKHLIGYRSKERYLIDEQEVAAEILEVRLDGRLVVRLEDGTIREFGMREIRWLGAQN